jgi:hypothetical protein
MKTARSLCASVLYLAGILLVVLALVIEGEREN